MKPLNRPMFQRGGKVSSRNNGIVSGFDNGGRVGYKPGGAVGYLEEMGLFEEPQRQSGLSTADYLRIASAGADIMGAQPTGRSGFIGALQAASPSLGSLGRDLASSSAAKEQAYQAKLAANKKLQVGAALSDFERQEDQAYQDKVRQEEQQDRVDLLTIEIQGKLDIEAAKASDIANRISLAEPLHEELGEVIAQKQQLFANPNASLEDKTSALSQIQSLNYQISGIMGQAIDVGDLSDDEQKQIRYTSEAMAQNDLDLDFGSADAFTFREEIGAEKFKQYQELVETYRQFYTIQSIITLTPGLRSTKAEGGRVGLQEGGDPMMAQQAQAQPQSNSVGLTFEELRARLPQEVTDGVVRLLATSEEALLAFANLETQEDIAQFNQKYNTDLQLPAQVA
jgi:hypothetical protein|tara:strand:+ start:19 stop:1209 length:1191 start_codon:yes stop_codon:yes gene_type:complete